MYIQNIFRLTPFYICFILIFNLIFTVSPQKTLAVDPKFKACEPQNCGNGPNISYPFWFSHQESFCGYPNFQINCTHKSPVLTISNHDFIIKEIFYSNNSLIVANAAVYDEECQAPRHNLSLDRTPFRYSPDHIDFSFFYNCSEEPPDQIYPFPVDCASNTTHHSFAVFHKEALMNMNYSLDWCQSSVDVAVDVAENVSFNKLLNMNYAEIMKMGFVLNWTAHGCSNCQKSGGRCGYDNNEFVCFCHDGPHAKTCHDEEGINWQVKIIIGVVAGLIGVLIMCMVFFIYLRHIRKRNAPIYVKSRDISSDTFSSVKDVENRSTYHGVHIFDYDELLKATDNFDSSKELGDGGFGTVYFGKLCDGRTVAVKRLYENNFRRVEQFMNEVAILARLRHQNLVSLYGCTSRHSRELLLVYEYVPNGTVADHLHGERAKPKGLPWSTRMNIAIETASALTYLHASEIVHRDVKTNNILLDKNFSVKVADFGLSRLFPSDVTHVSTAPQGTPGYVDPDYHQCYQLTSKSDVFSFGVVLMELVSSLPAVDITRHRHEINLSTMAINKIQNHALHELVDPYLGFESDLRIRKMITAVAELAFQCLQGEKDIRPSMPDVMEELKRIQSKDYKEEEAEDKITSADEAVLLKSGPLTLSPDSVNSNWLSWATTPNESG
ncbi:LEAF RUST 10 DISEASE-RESISTANCE LOCUS RECEPTOR-LIKE PROTEIN KINASE-like 1.2 isoform X2 [Ziziphus jujuba]|uniref:non-specific serine/threonine protein kinase n=1 Tax=Ziziphus jujuba TaxID=326968 RepID=A0A6P4AAP8_ZIZJJ|nr:LEAF RUST 10 DISEASE-RESISTANCE LOCUS RECEPTOR-LIKE PROTEIN KINASE-like 1.2 isoform X2 [Ziziphus jujuba]